jgi:glyoxylase I family protein
MILGLEHSAIATPDPQKLAQWYVETLGFTINYNSGKTVFVKAPNGSMIEIITSEGAPAPQTLKDPGLRHLALAVDDFGETYSQLQSKGVKFVSEPLVTKDVQVVFFTDPDGNFLHLIQRQAPLP